MLNRGDQHDDTMVHNLSPLLDQHPRLQQETRKGSGDMQQENGERSLCENVPSNQDPSALLRKMEHLPKFKACTECACVEEFTRAKLYTEHTLWLLQSLS